MLLNSYTNSLKLHYAQNQAAGDANKINCKEEGRYSVDFSVTREKEKKRVILLAALGWLEIYIRLISKITIESACKLIKHYVDIPN